MGLVLLTERHAKQIAGVLSCYDRLIVQGTLPVFCYADGMTAYLTKRSIRIFDFTQFAKPLTDAIKANLTPFFAGMVLLLLPATQAAVAFVNGLANLLVLPKVLPRLDFSKSIPDNCATVVAVPTRHWAPARQQVYSFSTASATASV
jgi:hypothetical protein